MRLRLILFSLLLIFADVWTASAHDRVTPFLADASHNTGIAVVVCPGGSYSWLDMETEGIGVAQWLQSEGINAYVLRYRVPTVSTVTALRVLGCGWHWPAMLTDVEDALRYVYEHAAEDGVDTTMIGVMGFSAGGHLTMSSFLYNRTPFRPHFLCPIYPVVTMSDPVLTHRRSRRGVFGWWGQFDREKREQLSLEKNIPADCPPVFLVNCQDDPIVRYQNSMLLDSALTEAKVEHTYIQYQTGGHGFGASETKGTAECRQWKNEFLQWILNLKAQKK